MRLREATTKDLAFLKHVRNDPISSKYSRRGQLSAQQLRETFFEENQTYVAVHDQQDIGYVAYKPIDLECEISIALAPESRGKKLASPLLETATQFALEELDRRAVRAEVLSSNEPSRHIFEKAGYRRIGTRSSDLGEILQYRYE